MPSGITWPIMQGLCALNMLGHALRWLQMDFWPLTGWSLHSNCQLFNIFYVQVCQELQNQLKPLVVWCCFDVFWCMSYLSSVKNMDYTTVDLDLESQIPQVQHLMICWVWFSYRLTGHPGKTLPQCADFSQCYGLSDRDGQSVSHGDNFRKLWSSNQSSSNFSFQSWCRVNTWQTLVFLIGYCWLHAFCFNFDV